MMKEPRTLTPEEIKDALRHLPRHRGDLRQGLESALYHATHGTPIKANAPAWVQARNAITVSNIDVDFDDEN